MSTVKRSALSFSLLASIVILSAFHGYPMPVRVQASPSQTVQMYLHQLPGPVTVAGVPTNLVMNTTTLWGGPFTSPNLRYTTYNFTLYPVLALSLASSGSGSIRLWITVSGAPGNLNATLYDVNAGGQTAVVSTTIGVANSTNPNTPYLVSIPYTFTHTFSQSSSIKLSVRASGVGQLYLWYDSAAESSSVILPVASVLTIASIGLRNYALNQTTQFSVNWTDTQRTVLILVHVDDPFGAYSISNATITISDPNNSQVYSALATPFTAPPEAPERLFGLNWVYSATTSTGNYTVSAEALDSAGNQATASTGFRIYSTQGSQQPILTPQPSSWPTWLWALVGTGIALAIAGIILALMFFRKQKRCPKCSAKVASDMTKCPKCGAILAPEKLPSDRPSGPKKIDTAAAPVQEKPVSNVASDGSKPETISAVKEEGKPAT